MIGPKNCDITDAVTLWKTLNPWVHFALDNVFQMCATTRKRGDVYEDTEVVVAGWGALSEGGSQVILWATAEKVLLQKMLNALFRQLF